MAVLDPAQLIQQRNSDMLQGSNSDYGYIVRAQFMLVDAFGIQGLYASVESSM